MGLLNDFSPVKTAVIGCGDISDIYFQNMIQRFKILEIVKCCSRGGASAEAKAEQYGIQKSTMEDILADPEIELIVNLTPAPQHYPIIRAALEAGKHVYTEKVITPSVDQTRELLSMAGSRNLYLCSAPDHFLGSAWQCAREIIDSGFIGEVTSVFASIGQNVGSIAERLGFVNEPAGGIGYDFGIYLTTEMVALLGPATEVCGISRTRFPKRVHKDIAHPQFGSTYMFNNEDLMIGSIQFASGAAAAIHLNGNTIMSAPPQFMIYGTDGILSLPNPGLFSGDVKLYRPGSFEPVAQIPAHGFDHNSRGVGVAEMAWAIRQNRPARASAALGLHCQEILQGIETSCKTKTFYEMTTTCERPAVLPRGYMGLEAFSFGEEGALVFG